MLKNIHSKFSRLPTPIAGLALGIASLGWCMENALPLNGVGQTTGAIISSFLLLILLIRFVLHPNSLWQDISHPVVGSIVPTFAMALMVISKAIGNVLPSLGVAIWLSAIGLHLIALIAFIYHRAKELHLHHMVPSWFVPPVGLIVADVTCPSSEYYTLAYVLLSIGIACYTIMLPLMIYRLMFRNEIPDAAKPTIAIMAAPESLSLAGYLTISQTPSLLICTILFGISILMTLTIYCAFFKLLKLQFTPGYAAFTFPMAIGATALYKLSNAILIYPTFAELSKQIHFIATVELIIATLVIAYVSIRYIHFYLPKRSVIFTIDSKKSLS
ncbi:TDT family transporter [Providencia burhodogranariea]|uniref:C4-dicarboxylate ABC transporter n=1 Tax=Providencia burhodogranariea DSM 19968 TaxID=1141662 RepID=K8WI40_9GAMM|nr:TDT family transporter [Providencia burhodogranariea]EKT60243.1 hypothetical protein OOA_12540 [Providencia burhodogranariea DSM 19968]